MSKTVFLAGLTMLLGLAGFGASREAEWQRVDEAIQKGLPKTAIAELEPIIQGALRDKAYGEAVKAIGRKLVLEGNIQGNKPEEKITRLEAEIAKAPKEIVPLLETLQAHWYWQYFQNNRWRFMRRTTTAQAPGKDFTTWDLPRLFQEIGRHFQIALSGAAILKKTPVTDFDAVLDKGTMPESYRPTLFDFIAHEALKFYTSAEQAGARSQDVFEISADDPIFGTTEEFLNWKPQTADTNSLNYRAVLLFQELLRFHRPKADGDALFHNDLERLVFGKNVAFGENKNARFIAALKRFPEGHPASSMARHQWAQVLREEGNLVEARNIALQGYQAFPDSAGGKLCHNLAKEIEAKSFGVTTERVWNPAGAKIQVRYRNLTNLHFRAVAYDWSTFLEKRRNRPEYLNHDERTELLKREPALAWTAQLPATPDYKERVEELAAPQKLKPGFYYIIASHRADFVEPDNHVSFSDVWVSELALIMRPRHGQIEGFVLEAVSGEPVAGAEVMAWHTDREGNRVANPKLSTDENGFFAFSGEMNRGYLFRVRHNGRELGSQHEQNLYERHRIETHNQTVFFTDRALYRPGQIIQYKGICLRVDQIKDAYQTLQGADLEVVFNDPNGKEIARQKHRCNDYGSFTGSFTAPRDRLMGQMTLRVISGPAGAAAFRVEEYKRPKFQVTLDAPKEGARLNEKVRLSGRALAYTGAAIDGAAFKYRVVRQVQMPYWWGWFSWRSYGHQAQQQEIAHGTGKTESDGSFTVEFVARPDLSVPEKDEPVFVYHSTVDVTDNAGETRSDDRQIRVGYTALTATMTAEEWQTEDKPVAIAIRTETLDWVAQTAEGALKVYRLKGPATVQRPPLLHHYHWGGEPPREPDLSNPNNWELGEVVFERGITTDAEGKAKAETKLPVGAYRAVFETQDRFGKKVTGFVPIQVLNPNANKLAIKVPNVVAAPKWSLEPGEEFVALWGTGYDRGRAFIEIEHRHRMLRRFWTDPANTQVQVRQAIDEAMRGGFTLHVTRVQENRAHLTSRHVDVPWSNKNLQIKWEHFTSKLEPAQKETWTAVITGPEAEKAVAEMVATLYDASLDAFMRHHWLHRFGVFRQDYTTANPQFENAAKVFQAIYHDWHVGLAGVEVRYREFPDDLVTNFQRYEWARRSRFVGRFNGQFGGEILSESAAAPAALAAEDLYLGAKVALQDKDESGAGSPAAQKGPDLNQVTARKNLNETAFFFPNLISDEKGAVKLQFTMPEALTEWRFLGFAHDRKLRSGFLEDKMVTAKDLMVQPNPPRFVREGDTLEFTVKISNQSAGRQTGEIRLTFSLANNSKSADTALGNITPELEFDVPAKESRGYAWKIKVPDGLGFLTYKVVASTGRVSDGEEGYLPVLSRRIFVTESLPLPIRGPGSKKFDFTKLGKSGKSDTLAHQSLTVQMVSNPSWYAVMALPYLMEFPYECSEQIFNRVYANALARHIANSDPKIRRIFDQWKNTPALDSPLEKNQDLKAVMLEETPWYRQAQSESQARRNVGILFDENRLNQETETALRKLSEQQLGDGSWPWFPGGRGNDYITLYITTGFGRLRHLGVDVDVAPAIRSLTRLDTWIDEIYREILRQKNQDANHLTPTIALYLYGRSFFLKDKPVAPKQNEAVQYFLGQAREHWLKLGYRQSQGHLAIALKRFGDKATATGIMTSINERSVTNEEMGMFWRDLELSWWWFRAPIETQALMIEAFDEVMNDAKAVEECKVWLLKQKQTQDWKTTKATADAVYALLLRGRDLLASDALVEVSLGGKEIEPDKVEAGTGFYEEKFSAPEIKPRLSQITVKKVDQGVAWGSVHWQYFEDMSKVTPHEGTPLELKKSLYTKVNTSRGPVLEPVKGPLKVGDELVVRVELRTDRDMEYVHLKDQRGSGTEPLNVISHYKYQDGLAYYESTRDAASHFFIDYLPKGVYVFEYSTRVFHKGAYQSGIAEIQCMYAPEFNSHSESLGMVVN